MTVYAYVLCFSYVFKYFQQVHVSCQGFLRCIFPGQQHAKRILQCTLLWDPHLMLTDLKSFYI